jgi:hypothetical protein
VRKVLLIAGLLVFGGVFEETKRGFTCRFLRQIQQVPSVFQHALSSDVKSYREIMSIVWSKLQASMFVACDRLLGESRTGQAKPELDRLMAQEIS